MNAPISPSVDQDVRPSRWRSVRLTDAAALAGIVGLWTGMITLVDPRGDFPLNDDWAYAWSVKQLLETGSFQLSDWAAVNLLPQALWGALFSLPFGFSFTALRLSTLALGLVGIIATYGLLREVNVREGVALAGALTLAVNPVYVGLSHSFMTDVPSFSLTMVSCYLLVRGIRRRSDGHLVAGIGASIVAIVNRQTGIFTVLAFGVAHAARRGGQPRRALKTTLFCLPGAAAYLLYPRWLDATDRMPYLYDFQTSLIAGALSRGPSEIAAVGAQNLLTVSLYAGVFLLPFLIARRPELLRLTEVPRRTVIAAALVLAAASLWTAKYMPLVPDGGHVLGVGGIGPSAISGFEGLDLDPLTVRRMWQAITVAGVIGIAMLAQGLLGGARAALAGRLDPSVRTVWILVLVLAALSVAPMGLLDARMWYDRYLMPLLPALMVMVSIGAPADRREPVSRGWAVAGGLLLGIYAVMAVAGTHDLLAWNRARTDVALALATHAGIPPQGLDAGWERNGWLFGHEIATCNPRHTNLDAGHRSHGDFTCLATPDPQYRVLVRGRDGYEIEEQHAFRRWLPPREQTFFVLRRHAWTP